MDPRRHLPGVDRLLDSEAARAMSELHGHEVVADALRGVLEEVRAELHGGSSDPVAAPTEPELLQLAATSLTMNTHSGLRRVINATGVVLHTNLGRAPIAPRVAEAMRTAALGYSNLEFDLDEGVRGSRYAHCVDEIRALTGAEDALVVNNCAAGLVLAVAALARGREVVVSRGELVEIGGGFRIPEMLEQAGAELREVGATNRARAGDYARALDSVRPAMILKVHRSNFRMHGFVQDAELSELVELAATRGVPLVHDLGSGLLLRAERLGLPPEPRPSESIRAGAELVIFSGDKLMGGPQAGLIAGSRELVSRLRASPMCRALRVDKVTLAGVRATLRLLRDPDLAVRELPALGALSATPADVERRARASADRIAAGLPASAARDSDGADRRSALPHPRVVSSVGRVGGGTYPDHQLASFAIRLGPDEGRDGSRFDIQALAAALRTPKPVDRSQHPTPVVGRIEDGALLLDLRTVLPGEEDDLARAVIAAIARVEGDSASTGAARSRGNA